jgi:hypothetical protein
MTDYYDGPRQGVADYRGRPHLYESQWSDIDSDQEDTFLLTPITAETFKLALRRMGNLAAMGYRVPTGVE